jgi:uncharacterized membrane protein
MGIVGRKAYAVARYTCIYNMVRTKDSSPAYQPYRLLVSLGLVTAVPLVLLAGRIMTSNSSRYGFMAWNLFLAVVPLLLAWLLVQRVRQYGWLRWQQVVLTIVWIGFLPNSFYMITDLIHLRANYEADLLFDVGLLVSFIVSGLIFGYMSVYMVQAELAKRLRERYVYGLMVPLFLAVSFAICLGRYTRWNTWDIILQPAGLLFDVSDRLLHPGVHGQTYVTTLTLFIVLISTYWVIWESVRILRQK